MIIYVISFVVAIQGTPSYVIPKTFPQYKSMTDCMKKANAIHDNEKELTVGCLAVIPSARVGESM